MQSAAPLLQCSYEAAAQLFSVVCARKQWVDEAMKRMRIESCLTHDTLQADVSLLQEIQACANRAM